MRNSSLVKRSCVDNPGTKPPKLRLEFILAVGEHSMGGEGDDNVAGAHGNDM